MKWVYRLFKHFVGVAGLTIAQVPLSVNIGNGVETLIRSPQNMACIIMAYEVNVHGVGFIGYYLNGTLTKIGGSNDFSASDDGSDICLYVKDRAIYAKMNKGGGGNLKVRIINANSI